MSDTVKIDRGFSYRLKSGTYRLRVSDPKKTPGRVELSLNTSLASTAHVRAMEYYKAYIAGGWDPWTDGASQNVSIGQAMERYERQKRKEISQAALRERMRLIGRLVREAGLKPDSGIAEITARHVRAFVAPRPDLSQASRASYYRKLRTFFNWCVEVRLLEHAPTAAVRPPAEPDILPDGLTGVELDRLLTAVQIGAEHKYAKGPNLLWLHDAVRLIAWTGLRPAEARCLEWTDLTWPGEDRRFGGIHVMSRGGRRTKNEAERIVTMLPQAQLVLDEIAPKSRGVRVLTNFTGKRPIEIGHTSKRFRHFRRLAGLPERYDLYSLRHTFAKEYKLRGGSEYMLGQEMGHKDAKTTRKYGQVLPEERMEYTRKLFAEP